MTSIDTPVDILDTLPGIILPGESGWDAARSTFNLLDDLKPAAIALPRTADEVAAVVRYARLRGLRVTAQGAAHGASSLHSLERTLLVKTTRLTDVHIDAQARRVRVGAGVKWQQVAPLLSDLGLAGLHGSSPDVGITGYSLGGGIGWLSRKYGLQSNAVTAIELVTADGELVRTDAEHEPELFWALRGGNGNFGIVTALEFEVFGVSELYAGQLFFPAERSTEVLQAWTAALPSFPDELMTWVSIVHLPPAPEVPEPLRGKAFVIAFGAYLGTEAAGRALLAPLRDLGPIIDTFAMQPPSGLAELAMDPPTALPYLSTSSLIAKLPLPSIEAIATISAREDSPLTVTQFRHMGGALARTTPGAGARATLPGEISVFGIAVVPHESFVEPVNAALGALWAVVSPYEVGTYPNFVESPTDASKLWDAATWQRLRKVKDEWDPLELFQGNHEIPTTC